MKQSARIARIFLVIIASIHLRAAAEISWSYEQAADLPGATIAHSAVKLDDGRVLVVGGYGKLFGAPLAVNLARIYYPPEDRWDVLGNRMSMGSVSPGLLKLSDGRVLIAGGTGQHRHALRNVELYDPATDTFSTVGYMSTVRRRPLLNKLQDGRILITGGARTADLVTFEENQPAGLHLKKLPARTLYRHDEHATVSLPDGSVLLVGGRTNKLERFAPKENSFIACNAAFAEPLDDTATILLFDGRVLIAGGQRIYSSRCVANTWLYDPVADRLIDGPALEPTSRGKKVPGAADIVAVDLYAGDQRRWGRYILLAGGEWDPGKLQSQKRDVILDSAWVYDAQMNRLIDVGPMPRGHDDFAAVCISSPDEAVRRVLLIGGYDYDDRFHSRCDLLFLRIPSTADKTTAPAS